ncbi:protein gamma response 1 [Cynara cardunculus var. scolymus]|uniref:protein gamma response 1 n=1 Tax=Cynara cardunculus var. scolymus TaxID=59895 RepID=UPI000D62721C|nr:protein gamma response 1 [Cynara cardunculus var. scolymus]
MEEDPRTSPELAYHVDGTDTEYISGLSTLLAATIQETKESVSQIEYLFCKQLFPDFQSKLKKIYSEAKKAAEDEWRKKENDLMVQVKTLQSEKQKVFEENQVLKMENSKVKKFPRPPFKHANDIEEELKRKTKEVAEKRELQQTLREFLDSKASMVYDNEKRLKELEEENSLLREKTHVHDLEVEELKLKLRSKYMIIEEKEESNCKLLQLVQSKVLLIEQKDQQLKDKDDKMNNLFTKLHTLEKNFDEMQEELREKTKEVHTKKEFQETLLIKLKTQALEILKTRQLLDNCEMENRVLTDQLRIQEDNCKRQQQLIEQNGSNNSELMKTRHDMEELQKENKLLIVKLKGLEEEVDKLQVNLRERSNESTEGMELHGKLLQQIEGKNSEIMMEKQKRREVIDAYKKLKSQYNYLCSKSGLTQENMLDSTSTKVNKDPLVHDQNILNSPDVGGKSLNTPMADWETTNQNINQQNSEDNKEIRLIHGSSSGSPLVAQPDSNQKTTLRSGTKRPISHWRDMRPTKNRNGADLHDDFLDTPLENIKEDLKKGAKEEEIHHLPGTVPKDMNFDSSDDETQDLSTADGGLRRSEKKSFKYVEPVRKKAERANLKGVECKQCKKFYDAVLPDGSGDNNKQNLRCEHHEGVSRHRYRFAPPSTPEGFWNIGFESEM